MFQLPPAFVLAATTSTTASLFLLPANIKQYLRKRASQSEANNKWFEGSRNSVKMSLDRRRSLSAEVLTALRLDSAHNQLEAECAPTTRPHHNQDENNNFIKCRSARLRDNLFDFESNNCESESAPNSQVVNDEKQQEEDELIAVGSRTGLPNEDVDSLKLIGAQLRAISDQFQRHRQGKQRGNVAR